MVKYRSFVTQDALNTFSLLNVITALLIIISPTSLANDGEGATNTGGSELVELAKASQNPVASMISIPFQNNTNFDFGPLEKNQNIMNIQPVYPIDLDDDWNLITRTIVPIISQPAFGPSQSRKFGLGDTVFSAFFSPKDSGDWIWGVGPAAIIPTSTDDQLGAGEWGAGVSFVALTMPGNWVVGSLVSNMWDIGADTGNEINFFSWQYFINYNLPGGWYLTSAPIITSNWEADSGQKWVVPFGGGFGKIFRIGKQPINASLQSYYNVEKPDFMGDYQLRIAVSFLFPK